MTSLWVGLVTIALIFLFMVMLINYTNIIKIECRLARLERQTGIYK